MSDVIKYNILYAISTCFLLLAMLGCAPDSKYSGGSGSFRGYEGLSDYGSNTTSQSARVKNVDKSTHKSHNVVASSGTASTSNTQASASSAGDLSQAPVSGKGHFTPTKSLLDGMRDSEALRRATMRPYTIRGVTYRPHPANVGNTYDGIASWYGPDFHARSTSNGETYNMYAHTAAHKTLPMNTIVRVYNKDNGKTTVVRINDRGPFVESRIIDLSNVAARDIDMVGKGVANVRLEVVGFAGDLANNDPSNDRVTQRLAQNPQNAPKSSNQEVARIDSRPQNNAIARETTPTNPVETRAIAPVVRESKAPNTSLDSTTTQDTVAQPTPTTANTQNYNDSNNAIMQEDPYYQTQTPKQDNTGSNSIAQQSTHIDPQPNNNVEENIISPTNTMQQAIPQDSKDNVVSNDISQPKEEQQIQKDIEQILPMAEQTPPQTQNNMPDNANKQYVINDADEIGKNLDEAIEALKASTNSLQSKERNSNRPKNNIAQNNINNGAESSPKPSIEEANIKEITDKELDEILDGLQDSNTSSYPGENNTPKMQDNASQANKTDPKHILDGATYMISLNVFSTQERAEKFANDVKELIKDTDYMVDIVKTDSGLYRVALRGFKSYDEAKGFVTDHHIKGHLVKE